MARAEKLPVERVMRVAEFRAALRDFQAGSDELLHGLGLTPQRYLLLVFVKGALDGGARPTMTELSERMRLSANGVTDLVARAEEAALVVREPGDEDQRFVFVRLTPRGERLLDAAIRATAASREEFAEKLDVVAETFRSAQEP